MAALRPDRDGDGRVVVEQRVAGGVGEDPQLGAGVAAVQRVHHRQGHDEVTEPAEQVDHEDPARRLTHADTAPSRVTLA